MKEIECQVTRIDYLESADGEYRRYIGGAHKDSEEYKNAKEQVLNYEKSARGALGQIVMSMKHEKLCADSYMANVVLGSCTECCDSNIYLFNVETGEQFEALVKWMKLQYPSEDVGVAAPKPYFEETVRTENGKEIREKAKYPRFYLRDEVIDPKRFIGKTVVVYDACDYRMYLEGTLEECMARNEFVKKEFEEKILAKLK